MSVILVFKILSILTGSGEAGGQRGLVFARVQATGQAPHQLAGPVVKVDKAAGKGTGFTDEAIRQAISNVGIASA